MQIQRLIEFIQEDSSRDETLHLLFSILEGKNNELIEAFSTLIKNPEIIGNTNEFASILLKMPSEKYIPNLVQEISKSIPGTTKWLGDYMYTLVDLLEEREDYFPAEESFVNLMGEWIFGTGGGEISWKAADILSNLAHPYTKPYFLRGVTDKSLFHLTRIACLRGIIGHFRDDADAILIDLISDSNERVKKEAIDAQKWLQSRRRKESEKEKNKKPSA
jgi:hypothetical protein